MGIAAKYTAECDQCHCKLTFWASNLKDAEQRVRYHQWGEKHPGIWYCPLCLQLKGGRLPDVDLTRDFSH